MSVFIWLFFTTVFGVVSYYLRKKEKIKPTTAVIIPFFTLYIAFALSITIFSRTPGSRQYELELFWSYKAAMSGTRRLLIENFWNVVLFVPIGAMISFLLPRRNYFVPVIGMLMSLSIEVTQLITRRGLFEFDDIVHNSLGAVIGVFVFFLFSRRSGKS